MDVEVDVDPASEGSGDVAEVSVESPPPPQAAMAAMVRITNSVRDNWV